MNLDQCGGTALRRAALRLHAMAPADQAWVLASLTPLRRSRLEGLLEELRSLGIPADAVPALEDGQEESEAPVKLPDAVEHLQSLTPEEVTWLADRLHEEPPEVAALLLAHPAWPWQRALLERLDEPRRLGVAAAAMQRRLLLPESALCEALVRMLPARTSARSSTGLGWWNRLLSRSARGAFAT